MRHSCRSLQCSAGTFLLVRFSAETFIKFAEENFSPAGTGSKTFRLGRRASTVSRCQSDRASPSRRPVPPLSVLFAQPQRAPAVAHGIAVVSVRRASREPLCFMRALRKCKILVFRCHARAARWSARPYGRLTFCPVRVASSRGVSCVREVRACPGPSRRDAWRQKRRPAWKVKLLPNLCTFRNCGLLTELLTHQAC